MSLLRENMLNWVKKLGVNTMKCGPIPQHIAFIMDGNRRFARKNNEPIVQGHFEGSNKFVKSIQWMVELGVKEVTFFIFGMDNFKRTEEEVDGIMGVVKKKVKYYLNDRELLRKLGWKFQRIGNRSYVPPDLLALLDEIEQASKENTSIVINLALSYSAREEMTNAVNKILQGLKNDMFKIDLNAGLFNNFLYTHRSLPVDLILRTSGETRLSDFLLYQGSYCYLHFCKCMWPEMTVWDMFWALFKYQRAFNKLKKARAATYHEKYQTLYSVE